MAFGLRALGFDLLAEVETDRQGNFKDRIKDQSTA